MKSNEAKVRGFSALVDYPLVTKWWKAQDWPAVPLDLLSNAGFVAEVSGEPTAAGWVFTTNSKVAIIEWIVADPEAHWETKAIALDNLVETMVKWSSDAGYSYAFTMAKHPRLSARFKEFHGFEETDKEMTHFIKRIG